MRKTFKYRLYPSKSAESKLLRSLDICGEVYNKTLDFKKVAYKKYDFISVEDLNINSMMEEKEFSKNIADASWAIFLQRLSNKAEEAGKTVVAIDPRGTSQMCSTCGEMVYKDIYVRVHHCPFCGLKIDRDLNASLNILRLGQQSVEYRRFALTS